MLTLAHTDTHTHSLSLTHTPLPTAIGYPKPYIKYRIYEATIPKTTPENDQLNQHITYPPTTLLMGQVRSGLPDEWQATIQSDHCVYLLPDVAPA